MDVKRNLIRNPCSKWPRVQDFSKSDETVFFSFHSKRGLISYVSSILRLFGVILQN